jgi:hypothetical protein
MSTMTDTFGPDAVPDFTKPREPHRFRLGGQDYAAPAIISAITLQRVQSLIRNWEGSGEEDQRDPIAGVKALADAFAVLVPGEHGKHIAERVLSEDDPVDLQGELLPCLYWLLGKYTPNRPTQPSPPSPNGSTTASDGTFSTGGASPTESTSEDSTLVTG